MRRYLFICGIPRSGTTILARLLDRHSSVVIGIERYKYLFSSRRSRLSPFLFSKERFFDFQTNDTNIIPKGVGAISDDYALMGAHFDNAIVVGDKIPGLYKQYDRVAQNFQPSSFLYVLRDIRSVASSWNARARRPADPWPRSNDAKKAVQEWNRSINLTLEQLFLGEARILVVEYEKLFSQNVRRLHALLCSLNLCLENEILRYYGDITAEWNQRSSKPFNLDPDELRYVEETADWTGYDQLRTYSIFSKSVSVVG